MTATPFYVSRQSNYYDGGAYSVEIADCLDASSPGALVRDPDLPEEGEFLDPRDAAQAAVDLRKAWSAKTSEPIAITLAMPYLIQPTVEDDLTDEEVLAWGQKAWDAAPKCEECGEITDEADEYEDEYGDKHTFCSDWCGERFFERQQNVAYEALKGDMRAELKDKKAAGASEQELEEYAETYGWRITGHEYLDIDLMPGWTL